MSENDNLSQLRVKRGQIKAQLTKFQSFINKEKDLQTLQLRLEKAELLWDKFDELQTNIEVINPSELADRDEFENLYFNVISKARNIIKTKPSEIAQTVTSQLASNQAIQSASLKQEVNLPQINLPQFSGNYEQWPTFHDSFKSLIHSNTAISDIQKFQYLRASLKGEAAKPIESLEMTTENYQVAWALLIQRFENKRLLINKHLKGLLESQLITKESHSNLRSLLDTSLGHIRALNTLGLPTESWDAMLIYTLSAKIDNQSKREWESRVAKLDHNVQPTFLEFQQFLQQRCNFLESIEKPTSGKIEQYVKMHNNKGLHTFLSSTYSQNCNMCSDVHPIFKCDKFHELLVEDRIAFVNKNNLCFNCLKADHKSANCKSGNCRKCGRKHNTLLHRDNQAFIKRSDDTKSVKSSSDVYQKPQSANLTEATFNHSCSITRSHSVILSTALVKVYDMAGREHTLRALLDCGSQSNLLTQQWVSRLGLPTSCTNLFICGIGGLSSNVNNTCTVTICSNYNNYKANIACLIVPQINKISSYALDISNWQIPPNIKLADEDFAEPGEIDLLIGAGLFWNLLHGKTIRLGVNKPSLQKTSLEWIVAGGTTTNRNLQCNFVSVSNSDIQTQLEQFWKIEEVPDDSKNSNKEYCETLFQETYLREPSGRFVVQIPLKDDVEKLGDSREIALKRLYSLERKLTKNEGFYAQYKAFMHEYQELRHMSIVAEDNDNKQPRYYLPHHAVIRNDHITTKLRVVFDGSCPSTSGYSLNNIQHVGPNVQDHLISILMRFRQYNFVVAADIEKMYRQVNIVSDQRHLQCILWRNNSNEDVQEYYLNTVTYGTGAAAFLATRCLKQLAIDNENKFPSAASIIKGDFYVDDLLTGFNTENEAIKICKQINTILLSGCFKLRKWLSNSSKITEEVSAECCNDKTVLHFGKNENSKILGIQWNSESDMLNYQIKSSCNFTIKTKRMLLSEVSQIFDPLGLISPSVIICKIILQNLWTFNLNWDDNIPEDIWQKWLRCRSEMKSINDLQIPRCVMLSNSVTIQLHGFCDASKHAYGACVYIRSEDVDSNVYVKLLCAKTRVAPLKTQTIPKLELCGALVLSKLIVEVRNAIKIDFQCFLWCDSQVVLCWIKNLPHLLPTFVSNRVSQIQELTNDCQWRHIATDQNPADLLSRGVYPNDLLNNKLWWTGPQWLQEPESQWPISMEIKPNNTIDRTDALSVLTVISGEPSDLYTRYSSLIRLKRITAYMLRFRHNCQVKQDLRLQGPLSKDEISNALMALIKGSQLESFSDVISLLKSNRDTTKHKLSTLAPFLDEQEFLRVGGRLELSGYNYDKKHPILISGKHQLSKLILKEEHERLLHAGSNQVIASVRERFWITSGRVTVKGVIRKCVPCFRVKPDAPVPLMGDLPASRIKQAFPFQLCGVDYAGPFYIKDKKGRGCKTIKCYIALFVCFVSKAIHLEPVTDLTTECFLATLQRFIARRGKPTVIYSDNGSNFKGASRELKKLNEFLISNENYLPETMANMDIKWYFIPPNSPHFGGLWEAGVKSTKYHLKRVLLNTIVTFEKFLTIINQIEGILNSRPLCPLTTDPNNLEMLTPAHFLIGRSLTSIPVADVQDISTNRLNVYQHVQQTIQHFWSRWSKEYIGELQTRSKWHKPSKNIEVGAVVLIKENNLPPLQWKIGRVTEVHPGVDGIVRVITVSTPLGTYKRAVTKICPFPEN